MLKIYLTDLAAYNKGFLFGEWIQLPMEQEELTAKLDKVLRGGEAICAMEYGYELHEEYFITDYEWNDTKLFDIGEYENISTLNEELQQLSNLSQEQLNIIAFLLSEGFANELGDAIAMIDNVIVHTQTDMSSLALEYLKQYYDMDSLPSIITNNINYDSIAHDLYLEGRFYEVGDDIYEYIG
jgi:hypothetical protein